MRWCSGCVKGGGLDRVVQRGFGWRDAWEEYPVVQPQEKRSMPGQEWQGRRGRNSVRSGRNSAAVAELVGVDHYDLRASKGTRKAWNCSPLTNKASVSILAQKHQSRRVSVTGGHSDATLAYQGLNQPWECWCFFFKKKIQNLHYRPSLTESGTISLRGAMKQDHLLFNWSWNLKCWEHFRTFKSY